MKAIKTIVVSFFILIITSCASIQKGSNDRLLNDSITESYAKWRSQRITNISYDLFFNLKPEKDEFTGSNKIQFNLSDNRDDLTIDYSEGRLVKLIINGKESTNNNYKKSFITLKKEFLVKGINNVEIHFDTPYSKNGDGLYKFKDTTDNRTYLYSNFEPYDANKMFPCFDQPDMKAIYTLTVDAPHDWQVITSKYEISKNKTSKTRTIWTFPKSEKFSTYIFSLHAGPYKMWKSKAGHIPLRLFARQSLAKHVKTKDWFTATKKGFEFYNKYFGYEYPFFKYDQIIVPDFNAGAMENVGAVTFSERYVKRSKKTRKDRFDLANVIYHEMAHMWFGDLVTMDWWNGLWLNESFATYMSYLGMATNTEFKESWNDFYARTKQWAYWEDQNVTTHPIELTVASTDDAFTNFDGITYGKGASSLKQLAFYIGPENFQKGIQQYFKTHAYKNTQLIDFISALNTTTANDLVAWSKTWLETASLNTITADFSCKDGKVDRFDVVQTAPSDYPTMRPHKTKVGLYTQKGKSLTQYFVADLQYSRERTSFTPAIGQECPVLVNLNEEDHDFVKYKLDPQSLKTVMNSLPAIDGELPRMMYWQSLQEMLRDSQLAAVDFVKTALMYIGNESSYQIVDNVLRTINREALWYLNQSSEEGQKTFKDISAQLEDLLLKKFKTAKPGSDFQKLWFDYYVDIATTPTSVENLKKIYNGQIKPKGFTLDQDRRWEVITALNSNSTEEAPALIMKEKKRDTTSRGQESALLAEAIQPDFAKKKELYSKITDAKSPLALSGKVAIIDGLFPRKQEKLHRQMQDQILKDMYRLKGENNSFLSRFSRLTPQFCHQDSYDTIQSFLSENQASLPPVLIKKLKISAQEDQRCINNRMLKPIQ